MRFTKLGNIYNIIRITGAQNNILGISFDETNSSEVNIEVVEWKLDYYDAEKVLTSKEEVLEQVINGLDAINKVLKTNYRLSRIYFSPCDSSANRIYSGLTGILIRHYHNGNPFIEV